MVNAFYITNKILGLLTKSKDLATLITSLTSIVSLLPSHT